MRVSRTQAFRGGGNICAWVFVKERAGVCGEWCRLRF